MSYKLYENLEIKIYLTLDLKKMLGHIRSIKLTFHIFHSKWLIPHLTSPNDGPHTIKMEKNQMKSTSR